VSGRRVLRGGLVGCGYFAMNHLNGWREVSGTEIVALCDRDEERLDDAGDRFGVAARFTDAETMFREADLDFVDVVTQAPAHRALVELAAAQRLHVICQKPFAPTVDDARDMVIACREAGVRLMVHENSRWQTPMRAVKSVIDRGEIGRPFFARISFRSAYDVYTNQPYLATDERFIIYDLGIHLLDLARFFTGDARQLFCHTQRVNPAIRGEDVATVILESESGASCVVEASYASKLERELFPQTLVHVEGDDGSVTLGPDYAMTVVSDRTVRRDSVPPVDYSWSTPPGQAIQDGVVAIQRHWSTCLREGSAPETSGLDNLRTLELVFGCYRSADSGRIYRAERWIGT